MAKKKHAWPADAVQRRPIGELTPYANNPRTHSSAQVDQIVSSIKEWGWTMPILVDETGGIIAGHGRVMAAERMGLTEVPVMVAAGWTEQQKRAYVIADNQIPMNAGWDEKLLRIELTDLAKLDFNLNLTGFDDVRLATFGVGDAAGQGDPDEEIDPETAAISKRGDIWMLGRHRIICGDSTNKIDVGALLGKDIPHLMVTDPPYGVNYDPNWRNEADRSNGKPYGASAIGLVHNDDQSDWRDAWSLFPGDVGYCWHPAGANSIQFYNSISASGFIVRMQIIWAKSHFPIGRGDYHVQHEPCWYFVRKGKTGHWVGGRKQTTVWNIGKPSKSETGHSTQKPVECMKRPIENNSNPGDAIYDPFVGSGTTIIAAEMTGRIALAVELSPAYVDLCVRRWQTFTGKSATLLGSKRTFAQIEKERASVMKPAPSPLPI